MYDLLDQILILVVSSREDITVSYQLLFCKLDLI